MLDYNHLKDYYKMIAIDFSKQETLGANPKVKQQINFSGNLARIENEAKETVLWLCSKICFSIYNISIKWLSIIT